MREFDKADEVATAPTAVTVEQVFLRVDVEGGMSILMQRTESRELGAGTDPMPSPVVPLQVLQQRNTLFEPFEVLAHGVHSSPSVKVRTLGRRSQARMVGSEKKIDPQRRSGQGQKTCRQG